MKFSAALLAPLAAASPPNSANVAMSMEGGGWRAQSAYAGVVSGLMGYLSRESGASTPSLASTGLLDRFDHFSSVSGGSWFFSSMAYSERYNNLLAGMAASPGTAAAQMNANWTTPILEATKVDPAKWDIAKKLVEDVADELIGTGDTEDLFMLNYFLATNSTWNDFTAVQLEAAVGIGPTVKMGSNVVSWAQDKTWLCVHSVLLPSGKKFAQLYQTDVIVPSARYKAKSANEIPIVTPAKFSIVLGAGEGSSAPHPYMEASAVLDDVELDYLGVVVPILDEPDATSTALDVRDYTDGVLTDGAGELLVIDVTSASSAAAGIAPTLGLLDDEGLAISDADLTPWVSNAAGGAAFANGAELVRDLRRLGGVSQKSMDALAQAKVHGLIDGGYTDGTGLANAVASGASEVVLLLDDNSTATSYYIELLCADGPSPEPSSHRVYSPIFETTASVVRGYWETLDSLAVENATFLTQVKIGSFNVTTTDNSAYGVVGGRTIQLHVVQVCGDVTIGFLEDVQNYNSYVQEIIETLLAQRNADLMRNTLIPMFTGASHAAII